MAERRGGTDGAPTSVLPDVQTRSGSLGSETARTASGFDEGDPRGREANVDDMTGEAAGHALAALLTGGASTYGLPVVMKKGRPGLVVSARRQPDAERAAAVMPAKRRASACATSSRGASSARARYTSSRLATVRSP